MLPADSLAVVDHKMGMNACRQGVFVLALQSSVMMYRRCNRCPVCLAEYGTRSPDDITSLPVSVLVDLHSVFVLRINNRSQINPEVHRHIHQGTPKIRGLFNDTFTFGHPTCSVFSYIIDYSPSINKCDVM